MVDEQIPGHLHNYDNEVQNVMTENFIITLHYCDECSEFFIHTYRMGQNMGLGISTHYALELEKILDKLGL